MSEEKIRALLVGELGKPTAARLPQILLDRLLSAGRNRFGPISERALLAESVRYFLARGVVDWEDEHREDSDRKKRSRHSLDDSGQK